jgi:hypothetical protein
MLAAVVSSWSYNRSGSSAVDQGRTYEWRDAAGNKLDGKYESWTAQASSSSDPGQSKDEEKKQDCGILEDRIKKMAAVPANLSNLACAMATFWNPDQIEGGIEGKYDDYGVGGSLKASNDMSICKNVEQFNNSMAEAIGAAVYLDCMNHPGRYYPYKYKPVVDADLDVAGQVKSVQSVFNPLEEGASSYCPPTMTKTETVDMGNGVVCSGDVTYECSNASASKQCTCDPKEVKDMVCTAGGR